MNTATPDQLRYPIGRFSRPVQLGPTEIRHAIATVAALPENLRAAVSELSPQQLETPYREGGWTLRQTVHHIADSHLNAYARFRLALTEDWPVITPYKDALWAELPDARTAPVDLSLELLDGLHRRWTLLLEAMTEADWQRGYDHPESGRQTLPQVLALYEWHSRHHLAHITRLRERMGW